MRTLALLRAARILRIAAPALAAALLPGCGDDDSTGPSANDIVGAWQATVIRYDSRTSPASIDLIADGGSGSLLLQADGEFELTITPAGESPRVTAGTWNLGGDVMTMTPAGLSFSWQFDCVLASGSLKLTGASAEWDFDGDEVLEEAEWSMEFTR